MRQIEMAVADSGAKNRQLIGQIHIVRDLIRLIQGRDSNGRCWLAVPPPRGCRAQLDQMPTLHERLVRRPRERNDGFDLRMVAVGRIHAQQFLTGQRQNAVVMHGGAARLRRVVDGAA